jgi:predicted ABC-type ATPase
VIVGGPNGAGKTTFAKSYLEDFTLTYLGADDLAAQIRPEAPEEAKIGAGKAFSRQLSSALEAGKSLMIESTLSGKSLLRHLLRAKELGYSTEIVFVALPTPAICIQRVHERVRRGGHYVPDEDVERRFFRSQANFWDIYRLHVDHWSLYFNTERGFVTAAFGERSRTQVADDSTFDHFLSMIGRTRDEQ